MAAAERREDAWLEQQGRREERMRYEVLYAIYCAAERSPCVEIDTASFLSGLGVWREELERVIGYLGCNGYLDLEPSETERPDGKGFFACLTQKGIDYVQREAGRRHTVRDEPTPGEA